MYYVELGFITILLTFLLIIVPNSKWVLEYSLRYSPNTVVINYLDCTALVEKYVAMTTEANSYKVTAVKVNDYCQYIAHFIEFLRI